MAMRAAGANCVRLCHYPHDESTLDLCDELGLAVFAAAFADRQRRWAQAEKR
jgi:beta-glucuronidase